MILQTSYVWVRAVCDTTHRGFMKLDLGSPTEYHHGPHKLLDEFEQITVMPAKQA